MLGHDENQSKTETSMWWQEDQKVEHEETEKLSPRKKFAKGVDRTKRYKPKSNREHIESSQKCGHRERREKCWI